MSTVCIAAALAVAGAVCFALCKTAKPLLTAAKKCRQRFGTAVACKPYKRLHRLLHSAEFCNGIHCHGAFGTGSCGNAVYETFI